MFRFFRDYLTILRARVFMHSAYAARYLGTRRLLPFSLVHYLIIGEQRGHRPNPFFDPGRFAAAAVGRGGNADTPGFAAFLRNTDYWLVDPCPQLDLRWYRDSQLHTSPQVCPFVHFWRHGFAAGCDPSPSFDLTFFKDAVAFYRPDKEEYAFECFSAPDADVPRSEADLRERQDAFYRTVAMSIPRRLAEPRRRFLVFIQAAEGFDNPHRQERTFDVLLNYYDGARRHDATADYVVLQNGTKTTAIRKLLDEAPDILLGYEAVLFLDDDVEIATIDVDRLFAIVADCRLDLAQPALTAGSSCAFDIIKQPAAGREVVALTAVEIMMPVVSKRALETCRWVFGEAISGWAVDFLLSAEVRRCFGNRVALVGSVVATHDRSVDLEGGAFYRFLRKNGIEATAEAGRIARRHGIEVSAKAIRRHPDPLG